MVFPKDFLWGVSISAFQFEMGGRREDWDTKSDWWVWVHDERNIKRGVVSGNLPEHGVNYWDFYRTDHRLAKELGLNAFRLTAEWSRIFPEPTDQIEVGIEREGRLIKQVDVDESALQELDRLANQRAVKKYRQIIQDLRRRRMTVFLNLNHFTLPIWIHDPIQARDSRLTKGPLGWLDERTITEFTKFAAYMAWKFGDLVDYWSTFNEPAGVYGSYLVPIGFPPNVFKPAVSLSRLPFARVALHMVIAHARAYDAIKRWDKKKAERKSPSPAEVGVIYNCMPAYPLRPGNPLDERAAQFHDYILVHWFLQAISFGWLDEKLDPKNRREERSLKGRLDWLGINYYTRNVIRGLTFPGLSLFGVPAIPLPVPGYGALGGVRRLPIFSAGQAPATEKFSLEGNPVSEEYGWEVYPQGLERCVKMTERYSETFFITENGISDSQDRLRPDFIKQHLRVVERLIQEGYRIKGYFHWSLLDNYEWQRGFKCKFGLCEVDLQTKRRKPRESYRILKRIICSGQVD